MSAPTTYRDVDVEPHTIHWTGQGTAAFRCAGDRNSPCHIYPECDCEVWEEKHDQQPGHEPVPHDRCWKLDWLQANEPSDSYGGQGWPIVPRTDGVITTRFEEDFLVWEYGPDARSTVDTVPLQLDGLEA